MSYAIMPLEHYDAICDAVREKTNTTDALTSDQLAQLILSISQGNSKDIRQIQCQTITASGNLLGDANSDGIINEDDIYHIQRYVVSPNSTNINIEATDLNSDGTVNLQDASVLGNLIARLGENQVIGKVTITYNDDTSDTYLQIIDSVIAG